METKEIFSEQPINDQWKLLAQYSYPANILKYLKNNGISDHPNKLIESISSSILQAEEFFKASETSSLQITPLLLYYGATNLLLGIANLKVGSLCEIEGHGMRLDIPADSNRIADISVIPQSPKTGALPIFCRLYSSIDDICNSGSWTIMELLSSIPELLDTFLNCYQDGIPSIVPIEVVKTGERHIDKIALTSISRLSTFDEVVKRTKGFPQNYLIPQQIGKYIILNRKMDFNEISIQALSGHRYFQLGSIKHGRLYTLKLIIIIFMILYCLSFINRYSPEKWNPFVRTDTTGEKLLIEKFLNYTKRIFPNLVINFLYNLNYRFVHQIQEVQIIDPITRKEILELIESKMKS